MIILKNRLNRMFIICFIFAFIINLFLIHMYTDALNKYVSIDKEHLDKILQMNISGTDMRIIKDYCEKNDKDFSKYLANYMMFNNYEVESIGNDFNSSYYKKSGNSSKSIEKIYSVVLDDIECFPVTSMDGNDYTYNNSFLAPRTYGGNRKHMGIDIIDTKNEPGRLEVVSMTDGIIENMGWLELGGYRVSIRSDEGALFYYAHLDHYPEGLKEGDIIEAGDLLGYMGDTGYGEEGTRGKFVVHLHIGIMLPDMGSKEDLWVNPYPILVLFDDYHK